MQTRRREEKPGRGQVIYVRVSAAERAKILKRKESEQIVSLGELARNLLLRWAGDVKVPTP